MCQRGNNLPLVLPIAASSYIHRQSKREGTILLSLVDWSSVRRYRIIIIIVVQEHGGGGTSSAIVLTGIKQRAPILGDNLRTWGGYGMEFPTIDARGGGDCGGWESPLRRN